jgi:hypothetical protein
MRKNKITIAEAIHLLQIKKLHHEQRNVSIINRKPRQQRYLVAGNIQPSIQNLENAGRNEKHF